MKLANVSSSLFALMLGGLLAFYEIIFSHLELIKIDELCKHKHLNWEIEKVALVDLHFLGGKYNHKTLFCSCNLLVLICSKIFLVLICSMLN